jgi:hypothetical protein
LTFWRLTSQVCWHYFCSFLAVRKHDGNLILLWQSTKTLEHSMANSKVVQVLYFAVDVSKDSIEVDNNKILLGHSFSSLEMQSMSCSRFAWCLWNQVNRLIILCLFCLLEYWHSKQPSLWWIDWNRLHHTWFILRHFRRAYTSSRLGLRIFNSIYFQRALCVCCWGRFIFGLLFLLLANTGCFFSLKLSWVWSYFFRGSFSFFMLKNCLSRR